MNLHENPRFHAPQVNLTNRVFTYGRQYVKSLLLMYDKVLFIERVQRVVQLQATPGGHFHVILARVETRRIISACQN